MKNQAKVLVQVLGLALFLLTFVKTPSHSQVVYNEGFEITNGSSVTYAAAPVGLAVMPMGWSTSKYCTTVGSYTAGSCFSTAPGFSRYGTGVNPSCTPRTGSTMLAFNSYWILNGEKSFVTSKKLDINTIGANSVTGSVWMFRDSGLYNATFDSISIHVNNSPNITTSAKRVTLNGSYNSMPRSYSQTPACPANSWYQLNFTIPNADVATWTTQGIYIIIMGHSADGNTIFLDDFSIQEYPLAAPSVVANQSGLTLQNTATTQPNNLNQMILGCKIQTTGSNATTGTKLTINNWIFNTNGSNSPPTDISAAKLWWTGGTNAFDPSIAIQIATVANPWSTNYNFLTTAWGGGVDPTRWLQYGDNYFWVTYDIAPTANSGNFVDAEWVSGQYNSATALTLTPQSLSGARLIDIDGGYCIPVYAVGTAWAGYTNNDYVQCVQLDDLNGTGGINNGPLGNTPQSAAGPNCPTPGNPCGFQAHPPDYEFFQPGVNKTAILTAANTYQIKVACGTWFSSNYIAAWIDYNKTGTFTNTLNIGATATLLGAGGGEKICQSPSLVNSGGSCTGPAGSNYTQTFTVPADALPGNTRLRVREVYATSQIDPCATYTYGETEDYVVTIIPPCAPAWIGWKTWLGFTDDWNNPANWCGGVPTINDNARIPQYGTGSNDRPGYKMPRIKSGITAVAKNLRIEAPSTGSDTSVFMIDAAALGSSGITTASLTLAEDLNILNGAVLKVNSQLSDTAQIRNGVLRTPTVPSTAEPFSNVIKKRLFYVLTQSDLLFEGISANDVIDTILIHVRRNGNSTEPMRNFTVKYYYTDGTVPGFIFNGAPLTGNPATNYRNMPNLIGGSPVTIYGPANVATSTFIPTVGASGTITLPLIANAFKWNGSTNKLVIEMSWDNTSSGIVPLGGTEGTTFTQTSTQGYRHAIGISETKVTSTYPAANFVVPFSALPQTSTAGSITWTAGTNTMSSTYANATFAVGQWVSGTGISVLKGSVPVTAGNATITLATGTTGIQVGMYVSPSGGWAAGVAPQVIAVAAGTVTLSIAPTTTSSYNLTFCPYITALSSATPPYTTITLNCVLPGSTTAGNLSFGSLHTTPTVGADYRSNLTFKVRRPYGKFPIEVRKDWVNRGTFIPGLSRVSMTTTTAGVVDSMYNASPTSFYELVINNSDGVRLYNADITITDTLNLSSGRLKANNQLITLAKDTLPGVLVRTSGGIQLDSDVLGSDVAPYGRFRWLMGSTTGSVDIPLYNQANVYIPCTYNRISGKHDLTMATYGTPASNQNLPASVISFTALNNLWTNGSGAVDRFYWISNNGLNPVASLTFRYANAERATYSNTNMRVQRWLGNQWEKPNGFGGTFPFPGQVHTVASPADGVLVPNFNLMSSAGQWMTIVSETAPLSDTIAPAVFITGTFSACQGNNATLTATGGFASYLWNTGATTQTINPITAGTYTVTATTASGSTVSASQSVVIYSLPTPVVTGTTSVCQGTAASLNAGNGFQSYLWNTGATSQSINPTLAGNYTVTVTDVNGCTGSDDEIVTIISNPTPAISGVFNVCQGNSATLTASSGFSSYLWSTGATVQTINPTVAGTYTVTVTNANGCTGSASQSVTITPLPNPSITGVFVVCQGNVATLTASSGFTAYAWSNGASTQTINPTVAGTYTVTVTNAIGCTGAATQIVTVNSIPTPAIGGNFAICQGATSTLTASSGFNAYLWNTGATTSSISTTTAGTFTVTVTDGNGCTGSTSQSVVVNSNPTTSITGTFSVCQGTAATLSAGSGFNTYLWNTGANTQTINPTAAGTYTVTVTNNNGCTGTASQAVTVITNPVPNITGTFAVCQGNAATLTASSGYATYLWNTGATTQTINPTVAGTYTVTVTASGGCSGSKSQAVTINANPTPSITGTTTICQNSSTTLTAMAGFSSYAWSTGATTAAITVTPSTSTTYTVTVTNSNSCTGTTSTAVTVNTRPTPTITGTFNPCSGSAATLTASATGAISYAWSTGATTQTINPTTAGTYTVTATNSNGCTGTASQAVTITSNPVPNITGTFSVCQGNAATLTATAGYTAYLWNTGATTQTINPTVAGTYTVTVTASSGCTGSKSQAVTINANPTPSITGTTTICQSNSTTLTATAGFSSYSWSTGATTAAITVTPSATTTYTVTVTNSNGCSGSTSTSVTVNARPVPTISGTFGVCSGAAATLTANATGATSYLWNTGATTQTINPTTAGTYTVTVTNSNGCTGTASQAVTVTSNPMPSITGTFIVCQGNAATLTASAGYTAYLWNTGAVTQTINPTAAGTYTVTVTGTGGCTGTKSQAVTVNPLPTVAISGSSTVCQGATTTWSATAGLTTYLWSTGATTANINVATAGTYTVTATNSNGCSNTSSKLLIVNPTSATTQNVNRCPGTSYMLPSGLTVSVAGTYNSTLTNIFGCDSIVTTVLTFNDNIAPVASGCPAAFTACNPVTWIPPTFTDNCSFSVGSNFQPGATLPLGNTTITYTATDAGGNSTVCNFVVTVVDFTLSTTQTNVLCFGQSNGSATVSAAGTSGAVSYLWSNGATAANNSNLTAGTYTVTVTNGNCSKQTSVTITQPAQFVATVTASGPTTFCQGGSVTLSATASSSYLWNTGATSQSIAATTSGNYFATVTNASGCTSVTAPVSVTVNSNVTASVSIASSATGSVSPTTSITFTATAINGGTSPSFQWKKNGVNVGTNSSTYTNNSWANLDVVTCVMTSNAVCVSGSPATSNAITVYVTTGGGGGAGTCKFVVSDVTANRVYYYDSTFTFIVSNPLSTTVLNGNTNAADVFMTATNGYILDGTANSKVYRSTQSGTVSVASRQLRTNTGSGLNPTTGLIIRGDTLYVVDKKGKAIYGYYLSQAYNGATTTLNAFAKKTLLSANSTAEALSFDGTYFYVLDNGSSVKSIYRYPLVGTAAGVRSRPMKTNTGANLSTVTGIVVDGNTVWIIDRVLGRALSYDKAALFSGSNTVNLNALAIFSLNSGNSNATGISITNTTSLLRQLEEEPSLVMLAWPNPTLGEINLSLEGLVDSERYTLRAYDLTGRLIAQREETGETMEFTPAFDLTGIRPGIYAIVVEQGTRRKTIRVVVE